MEQSQAISIIQRAWRNRPSLKRVYRECKECNKFFLTKKNQGWFDYNFCKMCSTYIQEIEEANRNYRRGKGPAPKVRIHYCNDYFCIGDCGVLDCGCIDVCRGRCGCRPHRWRD